MKYFFRGIVVFVYDPQTNQMTIPKDEENGINNNFNYCSFIAEDYDLIADFFQMAHAHAIGEMKTEELKDIEVY